MAYQQQQHQQSLLQALSMQQQQQPGVSAETQQQYFEIGVALGTALQGNGPAAMLTNPGALSAVTVEVLQQLTGDPAKALLQLAASMTSPFFE